MSDTPLVSIMMPAYNSGKTICFALASLIAQSYGNWECVVVDDGSTDDTYEKAGLYDDPRIRVIRQEMNSGEGAARQRALEVCRGELLAMLDADDWAFPDKLEKQVGLIMGHPNVTLVSCGMAVTDQHNELVGIRAVGDGLEKSYAKPGPVPVAHAPSLFRKRNAVSIKYDLAFRSSADSDFLRRLLAGHVYIVMPTVGYCYRELESARLGKSIVGYLYNVRGLAKFFRKRPIPIGWQITKECAKIPIYLILGPLGLFGFLIRKRSKPPAEAERAEFLRARAIVQDVHDRLVIKKAT